MRGREKKRFNRNEMKEKDYKLRKWKCWEVGSERFEKNALGCWGEMGKMRHMGV